MLAFFSGALIGFLIGYALGLWAEHYTNKNKE